MSSPDRAISLDNLSATIAKITKRNPAETRNNMFAWVENNGEKGLDYVGVKECNRRVWVLTKYLAHNYVNNSYMSHREKDRAHGEVRDMEETTLNVERIRNFKRSNKPVPAELAAAIAMPDPKVETVQEVNQNYPQEQATSVVAVPAAPSQAPTTVYNLNFSAGAFAPGAFVINLPGSNKSSEDMEETIQPLVTGMVEKIVASMVKNGAVAEIKFDEVKKLLLQTVSDQDHEFTQAMRRQFLLHRI